MKGMKPPRTILVVDDEPGIRRSLGESLSEEGYAVLKAESGEAAVGMLGRGELDAADMALLDVWLPGMDGIEALGRLRAALPDLPVVMISGHGSIDAALRATRLGAFDFIEKPIDLDHLLLVMDNALRQSRLERENAALHEAAARGRFFMAEGAAMKGLLADAALVAPTEGRVLLVGESGSGKEEVARLIHSASRRAAGPFVEVNCAAIPEELIESELFGHAKGAFTGALRDRRGKFSEADGGTLFLDEVGDMSLRTQAKVLRALQEGRVEPVGGGAAAGADARVIAATNKDLAEEMRAGRFREDLYFRLAVVPLRVPPLRERRDELVGLAEAFAARAAGALGRPPKRLSEGAALALLRHEWPGNVRELRNVMERAVILTRGGEIAEGDLGPLGPPGAADQAWARIPEFRSLAEAREWLEGECIRRELGRQAGSVTRAAERLGLDRSTLHRRMRALGIDQGGA